MITGDTVPHIVYLFSTAGVAQSYANKAAFTGAGWDITWYNSAGVALTSQPSYAVVNLGSGRHVVSYTLPPGLAVAVVTVPGGMSDPGTWGSEGSSFDEDAFAGLLLTAQGIPGVQSAADADLGDVVMGDAWNSGTQTLTLGKLTALGYAFSDLASGWTITAGLKSAPSDAMVAATATFGASVATDGAFSVGWTAFPAGLNLGATETSKQYYVDVQLKRTSGSIILTPNRYALRVVWERNTAT